MRIRLRHLVAVTCLGLSAVAVACSSDSPSTSAPIVSGEYKGEISGQSETGVLDLTLSGGSLKASSIGLLDTADQATAAGTLTLTGGISLPVTGTFDPDTGALALTAGGYTFTGVAQSGGMTGTYTGPNGSGTFTLIAGAGAQVMCGSYQGQDNGVWNLVVGTTSAAGSVASAHGGYASALACTLSGASLACTASAGVTANGTISGSSASGTWTDGTHGGTWSGSTAACPVAQPQDGGGPDATTPDASGGDATNVVDAPPGHDASGDGSPVIPNDASGNDATGTDAAGNDSAASDAATSDAATHDAAGNDAATGDAGLVCSTPVCTSGSTCGCTRTDSVNSYAMTCDAQNNCFCTVDGAQYTHMFTGPFTSCTATDSTGAAYTMNKYCACPNPPADAGAVDSGAHDSATAADTSTPVDAAPPVDATTVDSGPIDAGQCPYTASIQTIEQSILAAPVTTLGTGTGVYPISIVTSASVCPGVTLIQLSLASNPTVWEDIGYCTGKGSGPNTYCYGISIPASALVSADSMLLRAVNPGQAIGSSAKIDVVQGNPTPVVTGPAGTFLNVGGGAQEITLTGTGFIAQSTAESIFDVGDGGAATIPTVMSVTSTSITIQFSAAFTSTAEPYFMTRIINPGPGGGFGYWGYNINVR